MTNKKILLYVVLSFLFFNIVSSKTLILENYNRLTFNDVDSLTSFDLTSSDISENDLNIIVKDLVSSDLINDVEITSDSNNYILTIYESIFVNEIYINGNIKLKNFDIVSNLTITNKSFVTNERIFFNANIIENLYSSIGQKNTIVNYYLEEFNQNSFNLIYEIKENIENFVTDINISGNTFLSNRFIKSSISIKEKKFFTPLSISNFINESKVNVILSKIEKIYINHGFLDVSVNYEIKSFKNKVSLYLIIKEGSRYKVNNVKLITDNNNVRSFFLKKQDSFIKLFNNKYLNNKDITITVEKLNKELHLNNNPNISFDYSYSINDNNSVVLNFFTSEQNPLTVKKIFFYGNSITKDKTLRKQIFIKPGEVYNKRLITKSVNNLIRKQYIDNAVSNTDYNDDESVDINILLTEKIKSGNFKIGAGYSAQAGVSTAISLSDVNFYGSGNKIKAKFNLSEDAVYYDLSYARFYLGKFNIENTIRSFDNYENLLTSYGYKRKSAGFDLALKFPYKYDISNDQYFTTTVGFETSDIYALSSLASSSVIQNSGKSNNVFINTSYIGNTTNNMFNPTSGIYHKTSLTISPTDISDDDYVKISSINNFYFDNEINESSIFILSKIGIASGLTNKIKTKDSFSLSNDFKGFQYSGIGPRDASSNYLGGTKMYQLTLGYSTPFLFDNKDTFILKYFGTVGSIFDSEFPSVFNSNSPRVSIGTSIDIMTPIGPLSFSLASPISKNSNDKTQTYDFSIGSTF